MTGLVTLRLVHTQPPGLCELWSRGPSLSTGPMEVATCESLLPETVAPILGTAGCPVSLPPLGISEELLVFQSTRVEWCLPSSLHAEPETDLMLVGWELVTALLNTIFCKNKNVLFDLAFPPIDKLASVHKDVSTRRFFCSSIFNIGMLHKICCTYTRECYPVAKKK